MSQPTVGVLALQGGVREHLDMLEVAGATAVPVRNHSDLLGADGARIDALVLPGGESSTIDRLLRIFDLQSVLRGFIKDGMPMLGTCAGLILLADKVLDPAPGQESIGGLDVTVDRNAFGNQLVSAEGLFDARDAGVTGAGPDGLVKAALIRAPRITEIGANARGIITHNGAILGATSADAADGKLGQLTGISCHPELVGDAGFHRALVKMLADKDSAS